MIVEFASTSQLTLVAIAAHSKFNLAVYFGAVLAQVICCFAALFLGSLFSHLPVNINLFSGAILFLTGFVLMWKHWP